MWILTCQTDPVSGTCADPVWLQWADLSSWQVSQLDPAILANAFGAGFIVVGTAFAIGRGFRVIIQMVGR